MIWTKIRTVFVLLAAVHSFLNSYLIAQANDLPARGQLNDSAETKEFTLTVTEGTIELNGVKFPTWTFNGTIPGPEIRVKEGNKVRIRFMNKSRAKHSLMFHGLHIPFKVLLQEEEPVPPGYEYTYEFIAKPSGTHLYHCGFNMAEHLDMGLYGAFIVEERDGKKTDKEFVYILDEWNSKQAKGNSHHTMGHPRTISDYDVVTINGKVVNEKNPLIMEVKNGEMVKARIINVGYLPHTLRFPNGFIITHEDGYHLPMVKKESSLTIMPGKRYDIILAVAKEGKWPFYHSIKIPEPPSGEK